MQNKKMPFEQVFRRHFCFSGCLKVCKILKKADRLSLNIGYADGTKCGHSG
ncbi:hypothetical protein V6W59_10350 [Mannheimia sp. HC-2023]|uniref:hypothetical protein n=1 Tax=Mannheimia indoligenes TaxID=3103145 RepID=UPI002FE5D942